jgi:hypothetical protein
MGLAFRNLDAETRKYMAEEIAIDVGADTIYRSPWLTDAGKTEWSKLILAAAANGSDDTLARSLQTGGYIRRTAERKKPKSQEMVSYNIPDTAPGTMAGEFNMSYVRALCRRALANKIPHLKLTHYPLAGGIITLTKQGTRPRFPSQKGTWPCRTFKTRSFRTKPKPASG